VDDEAVWLGIVQRALIEHHQLDCASTYEEALGRIEAGPAYDLALTDLQLEREGDKLGERLLGLLRDHYPATRRVIMTGRLPVGALLTNILKEYDPQEIIIKGDMSPQYIRKIVDNVLRGDAAGDVSQDVAIRKAELAQEYRQWHQQTDQTIGSRIRDAREQETPGQHGRERERREEHGAQTRHGVSGQRAATELNRWQTLGESFRRESETLGGMLADVKDQADAAAAMDRLNKAVASFKEAFREIERG